MAARAAQAHHVPRIQDRGAFHRHPEYPRHRRARRGTHRLAVVPDDARAHQPACVVDAARKVPASIDAMAAIDRPRAAHGADRACKPHIGRASCHLPADLGFEQAHGVRDAGGDHRAPADGAVGAGDLLDRAKDDERRQLGPAHRARQVHLQQAGLGQRLDHGCRDAAQPLAFVTRSEDLRDQASGRGHDIGVCACRCGRRRNMRIHDAAWAMSWRTLRTRLHARSPHSMAGGNCALP